VEILKLPVGQLRANCYILFDKKNFDAIIIDPGDEAEFIIQKILDYELKPKMIVATHGHFDHIQAVNELKLAFDIPFLMHKDDEFLLKRYRKSALHFTKLDPGPAPIIDKYVCDGDKLSINNYQLSILSTPGHTPGSVCLYNTDFIFTGDTIFAEELIGRTDFQYSNPLKMSDSIEQILELNQSLLIYPGHGQDSSIGQEKIYHELA